MCGIFITSVMIGPLVILGRNDPAFKAFCGMMKFKITPELTDEEVWDVCVYR
jgi:hypothetical protein